MRSPLSRRAHSLSLVSFAAVAAVAAMTTSACAVVTEPVVASSPKATLPATASPTWQMNNSVWSLAYSNGVVFVGGDFTAIGAPGKTPGTTMTRIAALHSSTGNPCTATDPCPGFGAWTNPAVNGRVWALNVTPDGSKLYAGGSFTSAKGKGRGKLAAFNLKASGAPLLNFNPGLNGTVRALASTNTTLFAGGSFSNAANGRIASYSINNATGGVLRGGWAPTVDGQVNALLIGPGSDSGNVVLGGTFNNVNGAAHNRIAQVSQSTGANGPMANNLLPAPNGAHHSDVKALTTDGKYIYLGAEGTGYGVFDGTEAVNPNTGKRVWKDNCLGATQAVAVIKNVLYVGSHSHNCSFLPNGGFPQLPFNGDPRSWHHLISEQAQPNSTPGSGGQLLGWFPTVNNGPDTRSNVYLGPRAMTTDGTTLWVGGEFTAVNGVAQRGLTRFTPGGKGAAPAAATLTATSPAPGHVTLRYISSSDKDDPTLTYQVYRDGTLVSTANSMKSPFWWSSDFVYRDSAAPAGTHTYLVKVTDGVGLTASSSVSVTTATANTGGYRSAVLSDNPSYYWRLNEGSGSVATDQTAHHANGVYRGNPARGAAGAIGSDSGITLAAGKGVSTNATAAAPDTYSVEAWFRSTTRTGGRIFGFNSPTSTTSNANRVLYMMNSGQLIYSIVTSDGSTCHYGTTYGHNGTCYIWSRQAYNDGTWHHVVIEQSPTAGMTMFVDGVQIARTTDPSGKSPKAASGTWQLGVASVKGAAQNPSSGTFNGSVDEFAVYPGLLSAAQVNKHWRAAE